MRHPGEQRAQRRQLLVLIALLALALQLLLGAHAVGDVVVGGHDAAVGQALLADLDDAAVAEGALDNAALGPGEDGEAALHESLLAAGGRDLLGRVVPLGQSLADVFRKVDAGAETGRASWGE